MADTEISGINIQDLIGKVGEIAAQIPEMVQNTVTIGILSSKIPDDGVDIVAVARMGIDMYASRQDELPQGMGKVLAMVNNMSDEELIKTVQDTLVSKGLDDLASNLGDGNLSRDDFIRGASEFGHSVGEEGGNSLDSLAQIQNLVGDSGDSVLIEGLVNAEDFLDKTMIQAAQTMSELNEDSLTGMFDGKVFTPDEGADATTVLPLEPGEQEGVPATYKF